MIALQIQEIQKTIIAVVTTGYGGYDKQVYRVVQILALSNQIVLVQVLAARMDNTEIKTHLGFYSKTLNTKTIQVSNMVSKDSRGETSSNEGWNTLTPFPSYSGNRPLRQGCRHWLRCPCTSPEQADTHLALHFLFSMLGIPGPNVTKGHR